MKPRCGMSDYCGMFGGDFDKGNLYYHEWWTVHLKVMVKFSVSESKIFVKMSVEIKG
jgi:hypothetical protein